MGRKDKKNDKKVNKDSNEKLSNVKVENTSKTKPESEPQIKQSVKASASSNTSTSSSSSSSSPKTSSNIDQAPPVVKKELNRIISDNDSKDSLNLLENLLKIYEQMDGSTTKLTREIKRIAGDGTGEDIEIKEDIIKRDNVPSEQVTVEEGKEEDDHVCSFCGTLAATRCTGCRLVFYCNRDCQKMDWKSHKDTCRPYMIGKRKGIGRLLTASRDLAADDIILKEAPLIIGPNQITEPVCLSCYRNVDGSYRCSKCTWPMCSKTCEEEALDHKYECEVTRKAGLQINIDNYDAPHHLYEVVTILRCLAFATVNSKRWRTAIERLNVKTIGGVSSENAGGFDRESAIQTLTQDFKLGFVNPNQVDLIVTLNSIFDLVQRNYVPTKLSYGEVQGLYPMASLLSHSCVPNTKIRWDTNESCLVVSATESIKKGDPITTIYTDILWGTRARREHLLQTRFISCACKRCADPTECGTNFSSILCVRCPAKQSIVLPTNSLDDDAPWECKQCQKQIPSSEVVQKTLNLGAEVSSALVDPSIESLEYLLRKWSTFFHPNHYHLHAVKHSLLQLYARDQERLEEKDDLHYEELAKKEKACKDFLTVCSQLDPALAYTTTFIGLTFFEYHKPILECAKWNFGLGKLSTEQLKKRMFLAKALLKKAMEMFKDEPEDTPEGQLFLTCKDECTAIAKWMIAVKLI